MPAPVEPKPDLPVVSAGPKKKRPRPRPRKGRLRPTAVEDPWKIPDNVEPEPPPPKEPRNPNLPPLPDEIEGYGISTDEDPPEPRPLPKRRPPRSPRGERPPESPYEVEAYDLDPQPPVQPRSFDVPEGAGAVPPSSGDEDTGSEEPSANASGEAGKGPMPRVRPAPGAGQKLPEGVWNFPAYPTSLQAWFRLSIGWFVLGLLVQQLLAGFRELPQ
jgi:hypothetical protein